MTGYPREFFYNVETLSRLSGWSAMKIYQDIHRGTDLAKLEDAAEWLAKNGAVEVRSKIALAVLQDMFGYAQKPSESLKKLSRQLVVDILQEAQNGRRKRGKGISKTKQAGGK